MKGKGLVLLAIVGTLIFMVAGCAPEAAPPVEKPPVEKIVWKNAHYMAPTSPHSMGIKLFWDEIEKRSEGRFGCEHFFGAALSPAKEQPDGLKAGLMQASGFVPAYYPSKMPLYNMTYLPCLLPFEDNPKGWITYITVVNEWLQEPPLKAELAKWDALPISETYPLPYGSIMSKVRISNLEELKGKKLRAIGGVADLLKEAGAVPVFTAIPEVYDAQSKGIIEGLPQSWSFFESYKIYEVSDYWTTGIVLGHMGFSTVVNIDAYEALPEDIKEIIQEVWEELRPSLADHYGSGHQKAIDAFKEAGLEFIEFSPEDYGALRGMAKGIWEEAVDKLEEQGLPSREAFNSLQDIIAKHVSGFVPSYL